MKFTDRARRLVATLLLCSSQICFGQTDKVAEDSLPSNSLDSLKATHFFSGNFLATNNGIAPVPAFDLGKPAAMINLSFRKNRWSFDPGYRMRLDGTPWFIFMSGHYKLMQKEKSSINLGMHPFLTFDTVVANINGSKLPVIQTIRNLSLDFTYSHKFSKHFSLGAYYFYSHCFDHVPRNTEHMHFGMIIPSFNNLKLFGDFKLHVSPRIYLLSTDGVLGTHFMGTAAVTKKDFPISLEAIVNQTIQSDLELSKSFIWNLSLIYRFNQEFVQLPIGI